MTITWTATGGTSFIDDLYAALTPLETSNLNERLYPSLVHGNVTIGVGYDRKTVKGDGEIKLSSADRV